MATDMDDLRAVMANPATWCREHSCTNGLHAPVLIALVKRLAAAEHAMEAARADEREKVAVVLQAKADVITTKDVEMGAGVALAVGFVRKLGLVPWAEVRAMVPTPDNLNERVKASLAAKRRESLYWYGHECHHRQLASGRTVGEVALCDACGSVSCTAEVVRDIPSICRCQGCDDGTSHVVLASHDKLPRDA